MERSALIVSLREALQGRAQELTAVYLFGSTARGTARPTSDVDLGVLLKHAPEPGLAGLGFDIAFELENALKRRVDVVVLNRAPADLAHRVLRDGVLVFEGDKRARIAFEVYVRAQYFDLAPLRRLYRHGKTAIQASSPDSPKDGS